MLTRYKSFIETSFIRSGEPVLIPDIPEEAYIIDATGQPLELAADAPVLQGMSDAVQWDQLAMACGLEEEDWWVVALRNAAIGGTPDILIPGGNTTIVLLSPAEVNELIGG